MDFVKIFAQRSFLNKRDTVIFGIILGILLFAGWLQTLFFANHDAIWLLHCTHLLLHGGQYYHSFFDCNPPLILLVYLPAFLVAKIFFIKVYNGLIIYLLCLTLMSVIICYHLLRRLFINSFLGNLLVISVMAISFAILPFFWFSEREQISVILIFPYLLWLALNCRNNSLSIRARFFISILAAIGFSVKPYFIVPLILVESYYLYKKGIRHIFRLETITIASFIFLYVILTFSFFPSYFSKILPPTVVLFTPVFQRVSVYWLFQVTIFLLPSFILLLWHSVHSRYRDLNIILLLTNLGFYCVFLYQRNLWYYHLYPCIVITIISLAILSVELVTEIKASKETNFSDEKLISHLIQLALAMLLSLTLFMYALNINLKNFKDKQEPNSIRNQLISFVDTYANKQPIAIVSLNFIQEIVRHYTQAVIPARFPNMLLVPGLKRLSLAGDNHLYNVYKREFFYLYMSDLKNYPPKYIFISQRGYWVWWNNKVINFSFLPFLLSDTQFAAFFKHYHYLQTITGLDSDQIVTSFKVYERDSN